MWSHGRTPQCCPFRRSTSLGFFDWIVSIFICRTFSCSLISAKHVTSSSKKKFGESWLHPCAHANASIAKLPILASKGHLQNIREQPRKPSLGPRLFLSFPPRIYYANVLYNNLTSAIGRKWDVDSASLVFGNMLNTVCFHVSGTRPVKSAVRNKCNKASNMISGEWCRSSATSPTSSAGSSAFNRVTAFLSSAKVQSAYSMHVKYHAIVLTNLDPVEAPQCNEQLFEIERHTQYFSKCFLYNGRCSAALWSSQSRNMLELSELRMFPKRIFISGDPGSAKTKSYFVQCIVDKNQYLAIHHWIWV